MKILTLGKLPSSTLVYAVFIMVIIAIICSALIMMSYYHKMVYTGYIEKDRVFSNVNSGINLLLAEPDMIELNESKKISLFESYNDSVELERNQWGIFELIKVASGWRNFRHQKIAFSGNYYKNDSSYAIYLADQNKPLSLCGNTKISGNCYLPKAGVKRAYIEGRNFEGEDLINGSVKFSQDSLPKIIETFKNLNLEYFIQNYLESDETKKVIAEELPGDTLHNSFYNPTILVYTKDDLLLDNIVLTGNIVLICEGTLEVTNSCSFEDILVYGRSVWIEEGFTGKFQLFAKDTINIGENVQLNYPSVIGLINDNQEGNTNPSKVNFERGSSFYGIIYSSCRSEVITIDPILKTSEETELSGQIYWDGIFDFKGTVYGSVACKKFLLKTPSSIYENHLLDVTIDLEGLSEFYTGIELTESDRIKKVIKWLY